jgi:hypothetical protein
VDTEFYTPWEKGELQPPKLFIPALPLDNPHNTPGYLVALNDMPPAFRLRYVEGNWRYINDPNAEVLTATRPGCHRSATNNWMTSGGRGRGRAGEAPI